MIEYTRDELNEMLKTVGTFHADGAENHAVYVSNYLSLRRDFPGIVVGYNDTARREVYLQLHDNVNVEEESPDITEFIEVIEHLNETLLEHDENTLNEVYRVRLESAVEHELEEHPKFAAIYLGGMSVDDSVDRIISRLEETPGSYAQEASEVVIQEVPLYNAVVDVFAERLREKGFDLRDQLIPEYTVTADAPSGVVILTATDGYQYQTITFTGHSLNDVMWTRPMRLTFAF